MNNTKNTTTKKANSARFAPMRCVPHRLFGRWSHNQQHIIQWFLVSGFSFIYFIYDDLTPQLVVFILVLLKVTTSSLSSFIIMYLSLIQLTLLGGFSGTICITLTLLLTCIALYEVGIAESPVSVNIGNWLEWLSFHVEYQVVFDSQTVSMLFPVIFLCLVQLA